MGPQLRTGWISRRSFDHMVEDLGAEQLGLAAEELLRTAPARKTPKIGPEGVA